MTAHGFKELDQGTSELVLAAHFNTYGTRLVTGSADHRIRVFDKGENESWTQVDVWRGHNGEVLDVKWNGATVGQIIGSIGQDLKLKIWQEDPSQPHSSGRCFPEIFSQSSPNLVLYVSIDFKNIRHETVLALVTRDGMLSLHEPRKSDIFDDWIQADLIWVCGDRMPRGRETSFRVSFQQSQRPNITAVLSGLDEKALSLAVVGMDTVKIFRIAKPDDDSSSYRFHNPVTEITIPRNTQGSLIRDVAWSPAIWLTYDLIATASSDGYLRLYEITVPVTSGQTRSRSKAGDNNPQQALTSAMKSAMATAPTMSPFPTSNGKSLVHRSPHSGITSGLHASTTTTPTPGPGGGPPSVGLPGTSALARLSETSAYAQSTQIPHNVSLVQEIRQEGVWKVEWLRNGATLVSTGDEGRVCLWRRGIEGVWREFADFGPEMEGEGEEEGEREDRGERDGVGVGGEE
ncbi:MAG: epoxide hydrolase, soluble (sEH) [Icmadophila ericetorum]|nr:epoxide hydrolase, soluble (sEH) [Icmadophila ericetorum]